MPVQDVNLAWLAGVIDGEGCFTIYAVTRKDAEAPSPSACLTITNSNRLLLQRCQEIFDELNIKYYYHDPKNGYQQGRKVMRIRVKNYSSLRKLVEAVLPFLVGKVDQAKVMLDFVGLAGQRGKLTLQERTVMMNRIKELNQHGHLVA